MDLRRRRLQLGLHDSEAQRLRNFIARGGFLMVDHFHGQDDWNRFMSGMTMVLPDAVVEDIPDDDAIFHDLYESARSSRSGRAIRVHRPYL